MKYLNVHLFTVLAGIAALFTINWQYGNETFVFFGFAENKEMEMRVEHPVTIEEIYVTAGMKVKKGDILLEVTRSGLELAQSDLTHEVAKLKSQFDIWEANIRANIRNLEAQKLVKQSEIQSQIEQLESEMSINKSLIKDLESIKTAKDKSGLSPNELKINGLKKELRLAVRPLESEIRKLKSELATSNNPYKIQMNKLKKEIGYVHQEEEKLTIVAPSDGIVGTVFCKIGERLPSFNTLITFYEANPTQVKAYVLESLILQVKMDDDIVVQSGVQTSSKCRGRVIGMGSRIVEIPERLRRNPAFKTYGREIIIEIPSDNTFLQKEKVILKLPPEKEKTNYNIVRNFSSKFSSVGGISQK